MKILFVYPDYPANTSLDSPRHGFYSEGLASISAVLKQEGHEVNLIHMVNPLRHEDYIERVKKASPDLVGFSAWTSNFYDVQKYANWTKEAAHDVITLVGGYHATINPQECATTDNVDLAISGEGEDTLIELCSALEEGKGYENIANLRFIQNGSYFENPVRPLIEDLDRLPIPDFSLFDYSKLESSLINTANAILSRGCPYSCTYCCNHKFREIYPNKNRYVRFRSPERAIEYLKKLVSSYPFIKYVSFFDDILPLKRDWFFDFIARYKREIGLPFACNFRVNLVTDEVVAALKDAGCYRVHLGVESGNDYIRNKVLNRRISRDQIVQAFNACHEAGIKTLAYNMVGLPYEDRQKVLETVKLNAEIGTERVMAAIFYPYPNTKAYEESVEAGFIPENFNYKDEVSLDQPTLTKAEVRFLSAYFRPLMKAYRLVWKTPSFIGQPVEAMLDRILCSRYLPHGYLTNLALLSRRIKFRIQDILKTSSPGLYLFIRNRLLGVSNHKAELPELPDAGHNIPPADKKAS